MIEETIREERKAGKYDLGIMEIKGRRDDACYEIGDPQVLAIDSETQEPALLHEIKLDRGVSWNESLEVFCANVQTFLSHGIASRCYRLR